MSLERALSKLGMASRSEARTLILAGRVSVDGRVARDPAKAVVPERVRIAIDGEAREAAETLTVLLHKPRGVVTTRRDPEGRPTAYELVRDAGPHLQAIGRLDLASSGLLLFTTDTRLSAALIDPANAVPRVYVVTVRGPVDDASLETLSRGLAIDGALVTPRVTLRKRSGARDASAGGARRRPQPRDPAAVRGGRARGDAAAARVVRRRRAWRAAAGALARARRRRDYRARQGGGSRVAVTPLPPAQTTDPEFQYIAFSTAIGW